MTNFQTTIMLGSFVLNGVLGAALVIRRRADKWR